MLLPQFSITKYLLIMERMVKSDLFVCFIAVVLLSWWISDCYTGIHELQKKEYSGLEYWQCVTGLHWWTPQYSPDDFTVLQ